MSETEALHAMLPWSHPFRMVDRMLECVPHERTLTCKRVTAGDATFDGDHVAAPAYPSFLIVEGLSQSAALLFRMTYGEDALSGAPLLGYLKARFRGYARPGDTLMYAVKAIKMTRRRGVFSGIARVDGKMIVATELAFGVGAP